MTDIKTFFKGAALVAASTIGAGIFALPYIFKEAGWLVGVFYLTVFSFLIALVHILYWRVLVKIGGKERILGLARDYLGGTGYFLAIFAIAAGLIFALVAYLVVGGMFLLTVFPALGAWSFLVFWLVASLPVLLGDKKASFVEVFGIAATTAIILFIFFSSLPSRGFFAASAVNTKDLFLPFGAAIFALAGWTSIERIYDRFKGVGISPVKVSAAIGGGTVLAALLCVLFIFGIFGSATTITADTISGIVGWPTWKALLLGILGLVAVWTSYLPISLEAKNAIERDLHWSPAASRALIFLLPPILVALGFNSFLVVVGLAGGIFVSLQYLLIISVGKKVLRPTGIKNLFLNLASAVFVAAAVYEIYSFVVR